MSGKSVPSGQIPVLPPSLIAAPPGVDGTPLHETMSQLPPATLLATSQSATRRGSGGLGPAFAGTPATTAMRIAAFTLDVALVALAAAAVLLISRSPVLAGLTVLELALGLWVLEARTGLTLGNALMRLRTARGDRAYSPGIGRQLVRGLITGAGFVVAVGAWVVVASSAWDRGDRRQTWADRAAGTVVVAVPPRVKAARALTTPI